jgi:uncharacterized membrane protein
MSAGSGEHMDLAGLAFVAALGGGLVAGTFFAFSTFVMRALTRLPPAQGIAAMQSINVAVISPPFMLVLFGTAVACVVLAAAQMLRPRPGGGYALAGAAIYVLGAAVLTIVANVPLNERLARMDPGSSEASAFWPRYVRQWTAWNHVRTAAALAASALLWA